MMSCRHIIAIDIASVRENLEELHNHMAVRANQEAALELIKNSLKRKATCLWEIVGFYYYFP
jgi:hypothetical protein